MIIVMNRFRVTPGREVDFEEAFKGRARLIDGMPGFLGLDVLRPSEPGGVFISMARWAGMAEFKAWTESEQFRQGHGRRHPGMFVGPPQLEIYEVVDSTFTRKE
ncbi:MAG: antibiotic biosynthesis monooxygenase [Planctomycetes bacterium]|nr:antibiotic biosynthesis monooxygenase [Planctomycetota bacterium]